ncbi:MAG: hypothetical protein H0W06_11825, partial [Chloroflexia bacterium]|nr:hypothetical protein [Chloroflexia bacterium]
MFEHDWVRGLDGGAACEEIAKAHRELVEVETRRLVLAAHWLDLHGWVDDPVDHDTTGVAGRERSVAAGAEGTPEMGEFCCAEFAALQEMHPLAGAHLLRNVANLRHRHPKLWQRVCNGEVRGWKALEVAKLVGKDDFALTLQQARWVDEHTHNYIDTLSWGQFLGLVEAKIIAADPDAAEARRQQAAAEQFVTTGRGSEHGLKTLVAKALAGDVIYFVAVCDRIAQILAAQGDTDPVGARRAKAIGILAHPAQAIALLVQAEAQPQAAAGGGAGEDPSEAGEESAGTTPEQRSRVGEPD